jgi:dCTP deaminase
MRQSRVPVLGRECRTETQPKNGDNDGVVESRFTKEYFVRFGDFFVLHPQKFVLGITLEWIRLPSTLAAYITGKSSWGRRGLIIETAAGIHPGFTGCLTLELTNIGEVPIRLEPGMRVCQVFFHQVRKPKRSMTSQFMGRRKPIYGQIPEDPVMDKLQEPI